MRTTPSQASFSSGELDPLLHERPDYQRFQSGLAVCRGFVPLRQGAFTRSAGTIFRAVTRGNVPGRVIRFEFAKNDALRLEFTAGWMRVWRYGALVMDGGSPYELAIPYTLEQIRKLRVVQSKDVIYLADGEQPVQKLSRFALDNWTIAPVDYTSGPFRVQNLDEAQTMQFSAASGSVTITGTGDIFDATWIGSLIQIKPTDFSNVAQWTGNTATSVNTQFLSDGNIYRVAAGTNTGVTRPTHTEGTRLTDASQGVKYEYLGDTTGIARITAVANSNSASATVIKAIPQPCIDDPSYRWAEGAWSDRHGYPAAIELFDQSFAAAGTTEEPRTIWFSTLGLLEDFEPSVEADGSFAYAIDGGETQNKIGWLKKSSRGIYIGALGDIYRGYSNASGQRIGPTTFDTDLEATDGAGAAQPIVPYGYPILTTKDEGRVLEIRYSFEQDGGVPLELSLPAQHLGDQGFKEMAWQSAPLRIANMRRGNGDLAVMIYDPNEDVLGWAQYPVAGGFVHSIAVAPDATGTRDVLTMIVERQLNGVTTYCVEDQAQLFGALPGIAAIEDANHLFCASVFDLGVATDTFAVPHLEGEDVYAWTDQGRYGPLTVPAGGDLILPAECRKAVIGLLDETHFVETLDIQAATENGSSKGRKRRLHTGSGIGIHRTAAGEVEGVEYHSGRDALLESGYVSLLPQSVAADLTTAYTGMVKSEAATGYADRIGLRFRPIGGAPMTITSITPNVEESGP
ncbi:hypothetical protein [Roseobacter insulae]|nr:hypothetical protein [Roseobacter insulae]